eukprot:gene9139-18940_t
MNGTLTSSMNGSISGNLNGNMNEVKDNTDSWSDSDDGSVEGGGDGKGVNSGRWTKEEHDTFLLGLGLYGRDWKKVATAIKTRTPSQIRSHAQKYFQKLSRSPMVNDGPAPILGEEDKDAFTVLEYLETTLKSLKRRRDELDCTVSAKVSTVTGMNMRESDKNRRTSLNTDDNDNNKYSFNSGNDSQSVSELSEHSSKGSSSKDNIEADNDAPNSDLKLSRLHEEELIAVQVLCGSRNNMSIHEDVKYPDEVQSSHQFNQISSNISTDDVPTSSTEGNISPIKSDESKDFPQTE